MASATAMMAAGIFAHESGQRLLHILLALGERGFKGLYDKCASNLAGDYYQAGLRRVHAWSDDVLREDVEYVRRECPDFDETYEACFVQHVADRYRGRKRPTARCPQLLEFVRRFLESLGQHECLATGEYFAKRDPLYKRVACMDAARQALYALVTAESVRVELLSEAGASQSKPLAEASDVDLARAVAPEDSISQVGGSGRRPPQQEAERPPTVVSRASRRDPPPPRAPSEVLLPPPREAVDRDVEGDVERHSTVSRHDPPPPKRAPSTVSRHDPPPPPSRHEDGEDRRSSVSLYEPRTVGRATAETRYAAGERRHAAAERVEEEEGAVPHVEDERGGEGMTVPKPRPVMVSSRDSSVSIGMKQTRSPR